MKFCPTCQTRYDEEILRFCTKDGTPLVDESKPNFIQMPSESLDAADEDFGEETIIRRKPPANPLPPPAPDIDEPSFQAARNSAERIVIPTTEQLNEQQVRTRAGGAYQQPPPPKSNTAKVVLLTLLGTFIVLAGGAGVFWLLQKDTPPARNTNVNTNPATIDINTNNNLNTGNFDFNVNSNTNTNSNVNTNANLKTPTPTPKPSPSVSPSPSPSPNANVNANNSNTENTNSATPPRPSPSITPRTAPTATPNTNSPPANRPVNSGLLNGRALNLPKPAYPSSARAVRASGQVTVQISLDENGNVISAKAVSGNPLLRPSAEASARQARFAPIRVGGQAVPSNGILVYNFIAN